MAWALARVAFLIAGTCALGALAATLLDWRDARRDRAALTPPDAGAHWRRDHRDG